MWSPTLSEQSVNELAVIPSDTQSDVRYAAPLSEVIEGERPWSSWLEAAVRAGYIPYLDGIELALIGNHVHCLKEHESLLAKGIVGDAENCLKQADCSQELIALLEWCAAELERRRANLPKPSSASTAPES
jgi:hypothetical protein